MKILVADKLAPSTAEALDSIGCEVTSNPALKGDSLLEALESVNPQVLVVRSTKVNAEHLKAGRDLSLVIRAGAGVNTIDLKTASNRGVYVANCPGKNAIAVAELTMGHLLNMDRRIADNAAMLRQHKWNKKGFSSSKGLYGRTLAVLGTGNIGVAVIKRALAFGMKVRAWCIDLTPERALALGIQQASSPVDACTGADALTIHLALNEHTRGLVGKDLFDALKPGAYVINTSRGGLIDQDALVDAIETRGLLAGLDVYAQEPGSGDKEFPFSIADSPKVYGTHHIGASTQQAEEAVGAEVVRIITSYLHTSSVPNCVNLADHTPATHSLVVRHKDEVGVLAAILELLSHDGINVQEMQNVVFSGAGAACVTIQLDKAPSQKLLDEVGASDKIFAASVVPLED